MVETWCERASTREKPQVRETGCERDFRRESLDVTETVDVKERQLM